MKKSLILVLTLVFVLGLVAFQSPALADDGKVIIGYTIVTTQSPYAVGLVKGMEEKCAQMGWELVMLDAELDPVKQASQMDNLIARDDIDLILVLPCDGKAIIPSLKAAKEAGKPVIVHNSGMLPEGMDYVDAFIAPNSFRQGEIAAETLAQELNNEGVVALISATKGYQASDDRETGFLTKMEELAPNIKIVGPEYSDWQRDKAQTIMENFLTANPKIDGVYGVDDTVAVGAANAAKAAGRVSEMKIVGVGGMKDALDAIKRDEMFATIYQSPMEECEIVRQGIEGVLAGEEVDGSKLIMNMPVIDKTNVDQFQPTDV